MARYKVFPADHRKHSKYFEVWDTQNEQCKGQYPSRAAADTAASILNGDQALTASPLESPLLLERI